MFNDILPLLNHSTNITKNEDVIVCAIHQRKFRIPMCFCILFSSPLNKADLILASQSKLFSDTNYLKSTAEGLSFQILVPKRE